MLERAIVVLIHSPLVGPTTWTNVASELQARGHRAVVPALDDTTPSAYPYWHQHVQAVAHSVADLSPDQPLILVGHSGAGPLLPAIRSRLLQPVVAYVFVDAGIPRPNASRLDLLATEAPEWVDEFRQMLTAGGRFPTWQEGELAEVLPEPAMRQRMLNEIQPRDLAFFSEPLPVFSAWPDAPCVYLQFSAAYDVPAAVARQAAWPVQTLAGGHFHLMVEPAAVTTAMLHLFEQAGVGTA